MTLERNQTKAGTAETANNLNLLRTGFITAREEAGKSQAQLAREVGIHRSIISRFERGKDINFTTLTRLVNSVGREVVLVDRKSLDNSPEL
jgi:transcriptional regulator with XRE-family HTH domain